MSSGKLFAAALKAEKEYEELKRQRLGERFTVRELAELEDPTGFLTLYDEIIGRGLETDYERYKSVRAHELTGQPLPGDDILKIAKSRGVKKLDVLHAAGIPVSTYTHRKSRGTLSKEDMQKITEAAWRLIKEKEEKHELH